MVPAADMTLSRYQEWEIQSYPKESRACGFAPADMSPMHDPANTSWRSGGLLCWLERPSYNYFCAYLRRCTFIAGP